MKILWLSLCPPYKEVKHAGGQALYKHVLSFLEHLMNLLSECDLIIRIAAVIVVCSGVYTLVLLAFKDKVLRNVISQVKKKLHKKED